VKGSQSKEFNLRRDVCLYKSRKKTISRFYADTLDYLGLSSNFNHSIIIKNTLKKAITKEPKTIIEMKIIFKNTFLLIAFLIVSCTSNTVIYKAYNDVEKNNLKVSNAAGFQEVRGTNVKYLTPLELYKTYAISYKIGETIGFKDTYYLKTMLKDYKSKDGYVKEVTLRSYNNKDSLMNELSLTKTIKDTMFSSVIYKDLSIKKTVNGKEYFYKLSKEGKFIRTP